MYNDINGSDQAEFRSITSLNLFSGILRFQVHNLFSVTDIMCYFYIDIYFIYMYFKSEYN